MGLSLSGCWFSGDSAELAGPLPLRILLDAPPSTLNPRASVDATGQRLGGLIFRALTRMDVRLKAQPDLSESWRVTPDGLRWVFRLRSGLKDHGGEPIDAARLAVCLEEYRAGKPISALQGAFPSWKGTHTDPKAPQDVVVEMSAPDPYFMNNASLLRYFRVEGEARPCVEPTLGHSVVGSGDYRPLHWVAAPATDLLLERVSSAATELQPRLKFFFVRDDNTRALKLLRGEVDVAQNGVSLSKTRWLAREFADRFDLTERPGVNVSYLAFNHRDPLLKRPEVRRAIAMAIDREEIVRTKMFGFGTVAGSFMEPSLPGGRAFSFPYNPGEAEKLLDQAGLPRDSDGTRFHLKYRTTPVREGSEPALIFQRMLGRIGIQLDLDVVEPAVFLSAIQKGRFQLYSSRWVGVSDASIYYRALFTGQSRNRVGFSDPEVDRLLKEWMSEVSESRRIELIGRVQGLMAEKLAYFPLWFWGNAVLARKGARIPEISMSAGLEPLARIQLVR